MVLLRHFRCLGVYICKVYYSFLCWHWLVLVIDATTHIEGFIIRFLLLSEDLMKIGFC